MLKHSHNTSKIITSCKTSNKRYTDQFAECYIWHCDHAIIYAVYEYTSNFLLISALYSQLFTRELSVHVCKGNAVGQFCTIMAIGKCQNYQVHAIMDNHLQYGNYGWYLWYIHTKCYKQQYMYQVTLKSPLYIPLDICCLVPSLPLLHLHHSHHYLLIPEKIIEHTPYASLNIKLHLII